MHRLRLLLAALVLFCGIPAYAQAEQPEYVPGEVLVKFKASSSPQGRVKALGAAGAQGSQPIRLPRTRRVELNNEKVDPQAAARRLEAQPEVAWSEPNYIYRKRAVRPNDPFFSDSSMWALLNTGQTLPQWVEKGNIDHPRAGLPGIDIGATRAWQATTGSRGILVGVADTGVATHPDLNANLRLDFSRDFRADSGSGEAPDPPADSDGHGTHVAGTIGAVGNNGLGISGINWQVGLVGLRVLDGGRGTNADIAAAFAYAGQLGLRVVNASLGGPGESQAMTDAIRLSPGTLFVVAAGNSENDHDAPGAGFDTPCDIDLPNLICVAAVGNIGDLVWFSDYGRHSVDLGAPGAGIRSTEPVFDRDVHRFPIDPDTFAEDWETGPAGLEWGIGDLGEHKVLATGPLVPGSESYLNADAFSLEGRRACTLQGGVKLGFGPHPGEATLIVERSIEGSRWKEIATFYLSTPDDGSLLPLQGALHADGEGSVAVRMRVVVEEDADPDLEGVQIAGLRVQCLASPDPGTYRFSHGTSMAAPHVAGAAALLLAKRPELTVAELRHALLSTVRPLTSLTGKTVTGGMLDLEAAMAAIQRPAPVPAPEPQPEARRPRLISTVIPGARLLRRTRGINFRVTSNAIADVNARAVIAWRGGGRMQLQRLVGGRPSPHNRSARLSIPGRAAKLQLRPTPRQLRRLLRIQRSGRALRVGLVVRMHSPEHLPGQPMRRAFRLR